MSFDGLIGNSFALSLIQVNKAKQPLLNYCRG